MSRFSHRLGRVAVGVLGAVLLLVTAACEGGTSETVASGEPRSGGTVTFIVATEPRGMDPAVLTNSSTDGALGNALFGQLVLIDDETSEIQPRLLEDLSTTDGLAWTAKVRPAVTFSDGSSLDASAIKQHWDRLKDPTVASRSLSAAASVASSTVVDPHTLRFTLTSPNRHFGSMVVESSMNWVPSPQAIAAGPQAFDAAPVGAGPFVLTSWTRNDRIQLDRNPRHYDAPRPYLDRLVLRSNPDQSRRLLTLQAGEADMVISNSPEYTTRGADLGFVATRRDLGGANMMVLNTAAAPFDDVRARQALIKAVDRRALLDVVFGPGLGEVPNELLLANSPLASGVDVNPHDPVEAQRLLDELAAEGKSLSFTLIAYPAGTSGQKAALALQAQLSSMRNLRIEVKAMDIPGVLSKITTGDYQAGMNGVLFTDPEPGLYLQFHSTGKSNVSRVADPALDAALEKGRVLSDPQEREAAYQTVQERIAALAPALFWSRTEATVLSSKAVGGIGLYGSGSPLVDGLWKAVESP